MEGGSVGGGEVEGALRGEDRWRGALWGCTSSGQVPRLGTCNWAWDEGQ